MTISRPASSTSVTDDLDVLLDFVIDIARREIDKHGKFQPFAAVTPVDSLPTTIEPDVHGHRPKQTVLVDACFETIRSMRDDIVAGAVVWTVEVTNEKTAAIRVNVEHLAGHCVTVLVPFLRLPLRRRTEYGTRRLLHGRRQVWTEDPQPLYPELNF